MIFSVASVYFHESCNIKFINFFFFISSLCSVPSSYIVFIPSGSESKILYEIRGCKQAIRNEIQECVISA